MNLNEHIKVNWTEFQDDASPRFVRVDPLHETMLWLVGWLTNGRYRFFIHPQYFGRRREVKNGFYGHILMTIKQ